MIFILNRQEKIVGVLKNSGDAFNGSPFFDDVLTQDLATGSETFSFTTISNDLTEDIIVGNFIAFSKNGKYKLFQIMQLEESHEDVIYKTVYCESAGLELLNKVFRATTLNSCTLRKFLETVVSDTGWSVGTLDATFVNSIDLDIEDCSVYSALQNTIPLYGGEMEFSVEINGGRISRKIINVYKYRGNVTGKRFQFGKDIENIIKRVDTTELATALIGRGKNGLSFKDITIDGIDKPSGQDFVSDQEAFNRYNHNGYHITKIFEYDTESPQELLRETYQMLQKVKEPKIEYEVSVALMGELLGEKWNTVSIGDTVAIIDNSFNPPLHLMARVSKLETSFTNPQGDMCTFSNFIEVKSNITDEMRKLASQLEGYVDKNFDAKFPVVEEDIKDGAVTGDKIHQTSITVDHLSAGLVEAVEGKFEKLEADFIEADKIVANEIKAGYIEADRIVTDSIIATEGKFDKITADLIEADKIVTDSIIATEGKFDKITADLIEADVILANKITATEGNFEILNAQVGKIDTLVNGNLSSENIQTGGITGDNLNMNTVFIKDANIIDLSASKLTAGQIDTSQIVLHSSDGGMKLVGATQQFLDENNNIRIQLGKDGKGDFDFYILAENGDILFNTRGITGNAIENGLIKEDMIGEGAVGGGKINWSSFATVFNSEENKTTLNSSKIMLDGTGQTLNIHFNQLSSKVDNIQVGGRNLIPYTDFTKDYTTKYKAYGGVTSLSYSEKPNISGKICPSHILVKDNAPTVDNTSLGLITPQIIGGLVKDKEYTLSIKGMSRGNSTYLDYCYIMSNETGVANEIIVSNSNRLELNVYGEFDKRSYVTFKPKKDYPKASILLARKDSIWTEESGKYNAFGVWDIKLEIGNKPTDWSIANEDINEEFESHTTQLNVEKGRINTLVQDTTIIKDGKELKLKDEYSKLEQTVGGIKTTVGQQGTTIDQHTGKITATETKVSQIEQNVDKIDLSVKDVKTEVSNISIGGANLFNYTDYTKHNTSSIFQNIGWQKNSALNTGIAKYSHSNNKPQDKFIKDKQVLALNYIIAEGLTQSYINPRGVDLNGQSSTEYIELKPNTNYTLSGYLYAGGAGGSGCGWVIWGYDDDGSNRVQHKSFPIMTWTGAFERFEYTFRTDSRKYYQVRLYINSKGIAEVGKQSACNLYQLKLEEGNKATSYNNSDYDTRDYISQAEASIKVTTDSIKQSVSSVESEVKKKADGSTVTTLSNKVGTIETNVNSITQRVSATETEVKKKADNSTVTTLSNKVSSLETNVGSITAKVEEVNTIATSDSTNLVPNSNWLKGADGWKLSHSYSGNYAYGISGSASLKEDKHYIRIGNTTNNTLEYQYADSPKFPVNAGEKVTFGLYGATTNNVTVTAYVLFTDNTQDITVNNSYLSPYSTIEFTSSAYTKKSITLTAPTGTVRAFVRIRIQKKDKNINTDSTAVFSSIMVARGEVVQKWTSSQDDGFIYTDKKSSEIKVDLDGISTKVTNIETNKANKGDVYTKTETDSKITQSANSIKTEVSSTYLSKTDATSTYATKSSLTQTTDSITMQFESTGGNNCVRNGNFRGHFSQWTNWGSPSKRQIGNYVAHGSESSTSLYLITTGNDQGVSQIISGLVPNQAHTVRARMYVKSGKPVIMFNDNNTFTQWVWNETTNTYPSSSWHTICFTFTPKSESVTLYLGKSAKSSATAGEYHFSNVSITKGVVEDSKNKLVAPPYTSHPSEAYEGVTKIDGDGVRCDFEDGSYAQMGREGFMWHKGSTGKSYHALSYQGECNTNANIQTGVVITLPAEFRNKDFSILATPKNVKRDGLAVMYWLNCYYSSRDVVNGTFKVHGTCDWRDAQSGSLLPATGITVQYMVIA